MDPRDSMSTTNVPKGGGGSGSVTDEDGILSVTATLAKEASMLFQSEKLAECVEVLNQLLQKKEGDPKILHNIAIAEFLRDGCTDPKKVVEVLINVKRKSKDLATASGEQTDTAIQAANQSNSGSKGTNTSTHCAGAVSAGEIDASVAALNIATILFHLHEYAKALSVLEPLFQNIEPIDETTALQVCLLLLDVTVLTEDASKFLDVINYLEKAFGVTYMLNQTDGGSTVQQHMPNLVMKSSPIPNKSSTSDDLNSEGTIGGNASEGSLSRTLSDETMEYATLLSTFDISGQSRSRPNISSSSDIPRISVDRSTPTVNLKLQLPLYKIKLLLLTRNLKAAKREVKQAMNIAREVDSSRALLLKSQLEYARGNYSKAYKLLRASSNQSDVGSSIITNNNIGCIYYQQGKHHTSSIFFHKALSNCSSLWKEKPRKLTTFSQDKSLLIAYNCGLQYLVCGKPLLAARCFAKASLVFYNRPLLWLRFAECCLVAIEKGFLKCSKNSICDSPVKVHVIGQGKWRQLALENGSIRNGSMNPEEMDASPLDRNGKIKLSLPFARQCLLNALHLVSGSESKNMKSGLSSKTSLEESESSESSESSDTTAPKNAAHKNSSDPKAKESNGDAREQRGGPQTTTEYEDVCRRENQKIKQAILIDLAFVELELGNPLKALSTALSLLNLQECSRMYAFWGHVYAAEALCLMNRPNDAAEHLSTYLSGGNNVEVPYSDDDCKQWQAKKTMDTEESSTGQSDQQDNVFLGPEEARRALFVNLASVCATRGDFEQASQFNAQALTIAPNGQDATLMAVYLNLKLGKTGEALTNLKRWCRVSFLPYVSRSKNDS